jgi:hypothetical protein
MVVSGGVKCAANSASLIPAMERSRGTATPSCLASINAPKARTSVPQITAVGRLLDRSRGTVAVEPYSQPIQGISSFDAIEIANSQQGGNINAVLVEADSIENLRAAYPNYFGDVQKFKSALEVITTGLPSREFVLPPQPTAPKPPYEKPDPRWIGRSRFPKPKGA